MTPEQHRLHIQDIERMLYIADYGMGMPRDYQRVCELRTMLEQARKDADEALWAKGWAMRLAYRRGDRP